MEQLDVIARSNFHETDPFFNQFMDIFNKSQTFDEYFDYYQEVLNAVRNNL